MSRARGLRLHSKTRYLTQPRGPHTGKWVASRGHVKAAYTGKPTRRYAGYQKKLAADKKASRRKTVRNVALGGAALGAVAAGGYIAYRKGSNSQITSLGNHPLGRSAPLGRTLPERKVSAPAASGMKATKSTAKRASTKRASAVGPKIPAKTRQKNYGATQQELDGLARLQNRKVASVPSSQAMKGIQVKKGITTPRVKDVDAWQQDLKTMTRAERLAYREGLS